MLYFIVNKIILWCLLAIRDIFHVLKSVCFCTHNVYKYSSGVLNYMRDCLTITYYAYPLSIQQIYRWMVAAGVL